MGDLLASGAGRRLAVGDSERPSEPSPSLQPAADASMRRPRSRLAAAASAARRRLVAGQRHQREVDAVR